LPLIAVDFTIPQNTPQSSPTRIQVKVPAGVIRKVWVIIPPGHMGLAHLVIRHGETQIIPWVGDIHGDNESLVFDETYELPSEDILTFEGWNEDSKYPHMFIVRLLVLPKHVAYPEYSMLLALKRLLEVMGVE
jgi:predicted trehalose synthase